MCENCLNVVRIVSLKLLPPQTFGIWIVAKVSKTSLTGLDKDLYCQILQWSLPAWN